MRVDKNDIVKVILSSAQVILSELPENERAPFHENSDFFGGNSPFDSLMLASFVVELEGQIEQKFGTHLTLADERAMSQPVNPFKSVGTLTDYIQLLLSEK